MKEIVKNIWTWSIYSEEKGYNFNGYLVTDGEKNILIDPVKPTEEDFQFIHSKAPFEAIYLTNKDHLRDTHSLKRKLYIPTWSHEQDLQYLENEVDYTFQDKDKLTCGIEVIHLTDQKSPGESAFYIPNRKILILGDALIGHPSGNLKLLPAQKYKDINKAQEKLKSSSLYQSIFYYLVMVNQSYKMQKKRWIYFSELISQPPIDGI